MRKFVMSLILSITIPSHLQCVATLPCEMLSVLKATIENKTASEVQHPTLSHKILYKITFEKHWPNTNDVSDDVIRNEQKNK